MFFSATLLSVLLSNVVAQFQQPCIASTIACPKPAGPCEVVTCSGGFCQRSTLQRQTQCSGPTPCTEAGFCDGTSAQCPSVLKADGSACSLSGGATGPCQTFECQKGVCVAVNMSNSTKCAPQPNVCVSAPTCDGAGNCATSSQTVLVGKPCGAAPDPTTEPCRLPNQCSARGQCDRAPGRHSAEMPHRCRPVRLCRVLRWHVADVSTGQAKHDV
jgi:hypothetical protein